MPERTRNLFAAALALATVLFGSAAAESGHASTFCLELEHRQAGDIVWSRAIAGAAQVRLVYEHSLYRVPQEEVYVVEEGKLMLAEMRFGSYDALSYYDADPAGRVWQDGDGWHLRPTPDRRSGPAPFRVGYTTNHQIFVGPDSLTVSSVIDSGETALLRVTAMPARAGDAGTECAR